MPTLEVFISARDPGVGPEQLDLTACYTGHLEVVHHPNLDQEDDRSLGSLPRGFVELGGVKFDVRGVVQLRARARSGGLWQRSCDHYPQQVAGIAMGGRVVWREVWSGIAAWVPASATLRLYLTTYENPRPDAEVVSLDFESKLAPVAPFVVAMTVER